MQSLVALSQFEPLAALSQLEALHQRLSSLEQQHLQSVLDITVPSTLGSRAKFCEFSINQTAATSKLASNVGMRKKNIRMWLSTFHSDPMTLPKSLKVIKELMYREVSYAVECPLSITLAELTTETYEMGIARTNVQQVIAKFRKVNRDTSKMTEIEGQHAVDTYINPEIKNLFPHLYFIASVADTVHNSWECIGIEKLEDPYDNNTGYSVEDVKSAYLALKALHSKGFIHGDSHMGNFMRVPLRSKNHPVDNPGHIIMIDQDSIRKLPTNEKLSAVKKYLMIQDLNTLLLWNNPVVWFFQHFKDPTERRDAIAKVYKFGAEVIWPATPYYFPDTRDKPFEEIDTLLKLPYAEDYLYKLKKYSMSDIYAYYDQVFSSRSGMQKIQDFLVNQYNEHQHRKLPAIWETQIQSQL